MSEFLVDLADLARRPYDVSRVGGKARGLGLLAAAGIEIPSGFVLLAGTQDVWSADAQTIEDVLNGALARLGSTLVVRSSAAVEDGGEGAAAGVFLSLRDVDNHVDAVRAAAAKVCASADSPVARAYLEARGVADTAMAVIVQTQLRGRGGVVYTRDPDADDTANAVVELHEDHTVLWRRVARQAPDTARACGPLSSEALASVVRKAIAAERAIGATAGADVEWVWHQGEAHIVQARPLPPGASEARVHVDPALLAFSASQPERRWTLDITHNPEPLSLAQQGLVARANALAVGAYDMRCVGGYLYTSPRTDRGDSDARRDAPSGVRPLTAHSFRTQLAALTEVAESALAPLESIDPPPLLTALDAYDELYRVYTGLITPLVGDARSRYPYARGRGALLRAFDTALSDAEGMARLHAIAGPVAQAWDVAAPTYAEHPELLMAAVKVAAASNEQHAQVSAPARRDELGRLVACAAEDDDLLFWRAQAGVRRALLAAARSLGLPEDLVFHLPLTEVCAAIDSAGVNVDALVTAAHHHRDTLDRQRHTTMPFQFAGGVTLEKPVAQGRTTWNGRGIGGSAQGYVWRVDTAEDLRPAPRGSVVVTRTASPATSLIARSAAALVCEHGGLLGHGAALARELGIPFVVGCAGVWRALESGTRAWVDGAHGRVIRLQ